MQTESVRAFAEKHVRSTLISRYQDRAFSRELWGEMARAGLFRFLVPPEYGGSAQTPVQFLEAIEAFVSGGHDLGLCLSWLDHLLIHTHVIARFGTPEQKHRFLPGLAGGDRIGALAASEPGSGADPVKMTARAESQNGAYRIQARKIYITNGPVADRVIVLARTEPGSAKEGISAFVVDAATPGFRVAERMDLGFLNTSPHGELVLENCLVPSEDLLGERGEGHTRISRAVFAWERFLLLVALGAHFRLLFQYAVRGIARGAGSPGQEERREIAAAHVVLEGLRETTRGLACEVLQRTALDGRLLERLLFLGREFTSWWEDLQGILERHPPEPDLFFPILVRDARLLLVNQRLISLQLDRVARELLD